MKIVTFCLSDERSRPGVLLEDGIVDLSAQGFGSVLDLIASGKTPEAGAARIPLEHARLLAPIQSPQRIFCIGLNYRDHAIESKMEIPAVPTVFLKLPSAVIGPDEAVRIPALTRQPDYEVEFAVVIGKAGRNIAK